MNSIAELVWALNAQARAGTPGEDLQVTRTRVLRWLNSLPKSQHNRSHQTYTGHERYVVYDCNTFEWACQREAFAAPSEPMAAVAQRLITYLEHEMYVAENATHVNRTIFNDRESPDFYL